MTGYTWIHTSIKGLRLRHAGSEDAGVVLEFIKALAEYEKRSHEVCATTDDLSKQLGGGDFVDVVLADLNGENVGFMLMFPSFSTFLGKRGIHLEDLFVIPQHRGLGIGHCLLSYAAKLTASRGFGRLEWTVLDWNEPAIAFYRRLGAEPRSEWLIQQLSGDQLNVVARSFPASD